MLGRPVHMVALGHKPSPASPYRCERVAAPGELETLVWVAVPEEMGLDLAQASCVVRTA